MERKFIRPILQKPIIRVPSVEEIEDYNYRLLTGKGILQKLKGHVKKFGSSVISFIEKNIKPTFLTTFQKVANELRKNIKGARPLEVGELHPGGYNYMGPGTNIKKYPNTIPLNSLDAVARTHDLAYENSKKYPKYEAAKMVHQADLDMINSITPEMESYPYGKYAKGIMLGKYGAEKLLSLYSGKNQTIYG